MYNAYGGFIHRGTYAIYPTKNGFREDVKIKIYNHNSNRLIVNRDNFGIGKKITFHRSRLGVRRRAITTESKIVD